MIRQMFCHLIRGAAVAAILGAGALANAQGTVPATAPGYERPAKYILPGMAHKAFRGAVNLTTGFFEWPMQTYKGYVNGISAIQSKPLSKAVGTAHGFFFSGPGSSLARIGWGALELFGFWTANHADNVGVGCPLDAEYSWQWGEQYSIFSPTLREGIMPIPRKLARGLVDCFAGIAEVPSQVVAGFETGEPIRGCGRGMWFWWSREVYGFGNMFMCLVPNPPDNPGVAFNGKFPWSAWTQDETYVQPVPAGRVVPVR